MHTLPLLLDKITEAVDGRARIVTQGELVADSLQAYLERHPEIDRLIKRNADCLPDHGASREIQRTGFTVSEPSR